MTRHTLYASLAYMNKSPPMKRRSHFFTSPQVAKLAERSKQLGITVSELLRRILDAWIQGKGGA